MNYQEALAYVASLEPRGWRLGLDRMQEFVRRAGLDDSLGSPGGPQFIHVAGTNGKGSVTAFLQSMLAESGHRTGAFFSPYVLDPRERVQFGRSKISEEELADLATILRPIGESLSGTEFGGVTEFEFKTALGFLYWKIMGADWVALEVGLGGRLDATNVVTPRAGVIVSIGLDHTAILGDTHAKIAFEKAGIIKAGVPVIVGNMGAEALDVIESVAEELKSPVWRWERDIRLIASSTSTEVTIETPVAEHRDLRIGIPGSLQGHNLALAVAAMDAAGATRMLKGMRAGSRKASIPGRFQRVTWRDRNLVLDGAHNAEAAKVLQESLCGLLDSLERKAKVVLVTGMVAGHDPFSFYKPLIECVHSAHVVRIDFHRTLDPNEIKEKLEGRIETVIHSCVREGLEAAVSETTADDLIVVTGSFYLVGEAGRAIGLT